VPTVAELDVKIDAKDDATAKLMAIDALIKSMEGEDVTVQAKADVADAIRDLGKVKEAVNNLNNDTADVEVDIDLNDEAARAELDRFQAELARMDNDDIIIDVEVDVDDSQLVLYEERAARLHDEEVIIDIEVRAIEAYQDIEAIDVLIDELPNRVDIDVDVDVSGSGELALLRSELATIPDETVTVEVDIDGEAELARLQAEMAAIRDRRATVDVDTKRSRASLQELANTTRAAGQSIGALVAAALLLGPALVPLGGAAVGAVAALGSAFTIAGIGVGLFGAVAVTNYNDVLDANKKLTAAQKEYNLALTDDAKEKALAKMDAIWKTLTPSQAAAVRELRNFSSVWATFAGQFEPQIFDLAATGLRGMANLLPSLAPIVARTARSSTS
jgi:hypothetical protein